MPFGASRLSFLALSQTDGGAAPAARSTITVNGDAQIDTTRSKFGGASLLLDGTGDWVTIEDTTFGTTTEFTWECFFNVDVDAGSGTVSLMSNRVGGYEPGDLMLLFRNFDMKLQLSGNGTGGMNLAPVSMSAISTDTWHHVAVSRNSSGTWGLWFNGTRVGNGTGWTQSLDNNGGIGIGAHADGGIPANSATDAWFDEVRISSVARYDPSSTSITVPTSAFTNDSDTLALLHMDGTDGSVNITDDETTPPRSAETVTASGNAQISTAQSQFGGASAYFDGNDDYLTIDGSFNDDWVNGSEWTVEYWVRGTSFSGYEVHFGDWGGASDRSFFLGSDTGGDIMFFYTDSGGTLNTAIRADSQLSTNTWHHIALVKDSTNFTLYVDGSSVDSGASENIRAQGNATRIGASATNDEDFVGYIDEVRVSDTARYTGSFTPESTQFTPDGNTLLLLHMDGANGSTTFTDDTGAALGRTAKTVTAYGDAQVSTAQNKFGGASLYSDGATDYLLVGADSDFVMGSNDFTLECWVRPASTGVGSGDQIISKWSGGNGYSYGLTYGTSSPKNNIRALINDTGGIRGVNMGSSPLTVDAWNHVALVVESGTLALYANGNRLGTTSVTALNDATNADVTISALSGGTYSPNHYQDEVRISDIARYSGSTYTQPSGAFTNDANTLLLLHMDGANGSTTFEDDNS